MRNYIYIYITFPNGERWQIDAIPIAKERADYYATKVDGHPRDSDEWQKEVDYALSDAGIDDLIDYAQNNMNWDDFSGSCIVDSDAPSYQQMLGEAEWEANK